MLNNLLIVSLYSFDLFIFTRKKPEQIKKILILHEII